MIKLLFIPIFFVSCFNSSSTPESALENYIDKITTSDVDKDFYLDHTTGSLKDSILEMSDDEFNSFKQMPKIAGKKIKIISRACDDVKCTLTYLLTYSSGNEAEFKNEIKKIAVLQKIDDEWKIAQASNLKTYIEAKKDLQISNE